MQMAGGSRRLTHLREAHATSVSMGAGPLTAEVEALAGRGPDRSRVADGR